MSSNFLADITIESGEYEISNTESKEFLLALQNQNNEYFHALSNIKDNIFTETIFTPFLNTLDTKVFHKNNHLFFSFLGVKKQSSILHNVYGSYDKQTANLTAFPNLFMQISEINIDANEITLTNNSNTILPIKKSLMLMPQNIKIYTNSNKIILLEPNSNITLIGSKILPKKDKIQYIENIDFGYKAIIMLKSK